MSSSDVRNIESLERLQSGILTVAENWQDTLQEIRLSVHRTAQYFGDDVPRYWRRQVDLAEREITEALDHLQQKQAAARASDRVSALEAQKRVASAKARLKLCREKHAKAKALKIEMGRLCDEMLGPLADMTEHSDNLLPQAAAKLASMVAKLHEYTDASAMPSLSPENEISESESRSLGSSNAEPTDSEPPSKTESRDNDL